MLKELSRALDQADAGRDGSLERLFDFLKIPSVGTDPAHRDDTRRAGQWCVDQLADIGFDARLVDSPGHPFVVAHRKDAGEGAPHLLYYGHYDVQPADPLDLWGHPPFEPVLILADHGERIVARGAVDDKGQLMTFVEAFRAWHETGETLPVNVTVFLEGEEESGSPSLEGFLKDHADELKADVCVVCDTGMWDIATPAITTSLRGMVYLEMIVQGPAQDLHSGMFGGLALNPLQVLSRIVARFHDDQGRVAVPGINDDVREPDPGLIAAWDQLGFDVRGFLDSVGLEHSVGEQERTPLERLWSRPTLEMNGIWGGYIGEGAKTVIPAEARAKLSCRLVPEQKPQQVIDAIQSFVEQIRPADARVTWKEMGKEPAVVVPSESPYIQAAKDGLKRIYNRDAELIGCGGSIPVVAAIKKHLGCDAVLVGFSLDDDRMHSPNEKFERICFDRGIKSHVSIIAEMAKLSR
ncbi:MAG: dipeptidase [Geminicoccaceae bacterium]